ncbi:DNA polymerase III subunit beta [Mycoplasma phocoenae]|uniref:DNA polymerase III subunit beta n=1 Tax=Mycoplasma phocoenae TaxID=754517 RepID=A0A858U6Z0_9MOLU|nr:DNA polymerase III subunit beta [Mycoplasma phocoenae]QJG67217.1 DNA polymerase III subunit beta [Mycoplasma phocoenae]
MKFNISKQRLEFAVEKTSKAIDGNPFLPQLKGIMIEAMDTKITFITSNHEISVLHKVLTVGNSNETLNSTGCEIVESGSALIPFSLFRNIIKKLDGVISIETKGSILEIKSNQDKFEMNILDASDYPDIDFTKIGDKVTVPFEILRKISKNVAFAASQDPGQLILNCVNISNANGSLKAVATDKFRLALEKDEIEDGTSFDISILAKSIKDILNFDLKGDVDLYISESKIQIYDDNTIIQAKLINIPFIDTTRVIPKDFQQKLIINRKVLSDMISKVNIVNTDSNSKIMILIENNLLTIKGNKDEVGSATVQTTDFEYNDEGLIISFATRNVLDALSVFEGELYIMFSDNKQRVLILSPENTNTIQLITPMKGYY